ncbi:MAG: hypothetical protein L6Q78_11115 [Bacteroidia bacterium]|nr:hypothetical protein [Bacteroidia bacterium]
MAKFVEQEEIFRATNGGLDVILSYYPQASNCQDGRKKFKLRESEKTPSATLKRMPDGNWVVTDFGGDAKPRNAIAVVMDEENCDFKTAINLIADRFNIASTERQIELLKPSFAQRDANPEDEEGHWSFDVGDFTEADLRVLFSENAIEYVKGKSELEQNSDDWQTRLRKLCKHYFLHKLNSYSICKNRKVTTIGSTDHYPIFVFEIPADGRTIRKIYQPKAVDKSKRFIYEPGKRPDDYIFGAVQAQRKYDDINKDTGDDDEENEKGKDIKLPEIILCTGGSDALNVAALDYQVIWMNSESAKLKGDKYFQLSKLTEKMCILGDLDATGKRTVHEICMIYLDMRTIQLPDALLDKNDWRGNPCKDVRDFLKYWKRKDFDALVKAALPYRFWDEVPQYDKKGKFTGYQYECNNTHLYWFLSQNGYFQYTNQNELDSYIHINGNIVSEVDAKKVRRAVNKFLADRAVDTKLRNTFFRTTQLNATSFENLPHTKIDFTDFDKDTQWLFFENRTWKITKDGIQDFKAGEVKKFVWEKEVIRHRVKLLDDFFSITKSGDGFHIDVKEHNCIFFKFLERTCRMHWKVEEIGVEDGNGGLRTTLKPEEAREHELHLINKIYALGYLLHKYKEPSSAYAVWAMENEVIEDGQSEGRSGKSLMLKFPQYFLRYEPIGARDPRITENKHLLENVNEFTDYVLFDDCAEYLNFSFFFPLITGPWNINPKNTKSFTLSEFDSPKMAFSSNFAPKASDGSTLDRLIFVVFSDYYHTGPSERYADRRTPKDDFGMNLFTDFDEDQWNLTLNFGAQCIKAYLAIDEKINPPMGKVSMRQLLGEMGETFKAWADVYFSEESGRLNSEVVRESAFQDCITKNNLKGWSMQKFTRSIKTWCKFYGYKLNPKDKCNAQGRIVKRVGDNTVEFYYIETPGYSPTKVVEEKADETSGDLPF